MTKREEALQMAILYENHRMSLRQIGRYLDISPQTVKSRLASLGIELFVPPPKHTQIDKERLEDLYFKKNFPINTIAQTLGVSSGIIYLALKSRKIPQRESIRTNGIHVDLLKKLQIGEVTQTESQSKYAFSILNRSAKIAGIKITVKKLRQCVFEIIRLS